MGISVCHKLLLAGEVRRGGNGIHNKVILLLNWHPLAVWDSGCFIFLWISGSRGFEEFGFWDPGLCSQVASLGVNPKPETPVKLVKAQGFGLWGAWLDWLHAWLRSKLHVLISLGL